MGNPKKHPEGFVPRALGMQSRDVHSNKGKKMATKEGQPPTQAPKG